MADVSSRADQADDTPSGGLTLLVDGPYRDVLWPRDPPDVLVVDDQRKFADIVARSLERAGCATEVCTSLREMFTQIEHAPPDLLVLDRWLLDGDGVEACEALRCRGFAGGIIVMTGDVAAGGDARLAGADDFILKPFAVKELVTRAVALTRRVTGSVTEPPPSARVKAARAETRASGPAARLRTRRPVEDWDAIRALLDEHRADVEAGLRRSPLRMLRLLRRSGGGPLRPAGLADALGCSRASVSRAAAEIRRRISAVGLDLPCERSGYTLVLRRSTEELPAARDPR